jgi:hypothetical protein
MLLPVMFEGAKQKLDWRCGEFAADFAHEKTAGDSHMCLADIFKMVKTVLVSILAYLSQIFQFKMDVSGTIEVNLNGYSHGFKDMIHSVEGQAVNILRKAQWMAGKSTAKVIIKINALNVAKKVILRHFGGFGETAIAHLARERLNSNGQA